MISAEPTSRKPTSQEADLQGANFWGAKLEEANLQGANLQGVKLQNVNLRRANLQGAVLFRTLFAALGSLAQAKGLEDCDHRGPSSIDQLTLETAHGRLPEAFLKGCGFQDWEILTAKLYDSDLKPFEVTNIGYEVINLRTRGPIFTNALFISYTHADSAFVDFIHKKLDRDGIRSWRDTHDMAAGPLEEQIDAAISANKTVLLVLSRNSMKSDWVEWEVEKARKLHKELKERGENRHVLCPIAIDDSWEKSEWPGPLMTQLKKYNILDFSSWQQDGAEDAYQKLKRGIATYYDA